MPSTRVPIFWPGGGRVIDRLADVAGRIRVGDILPGDLQADLGGLQRVASELDGVEERHGECVEFPASA